MSTLRTDYKDDVFTGSRKYRMIDNGDGTVSFEDATTYTQTGDTYGAAEINEVNSRLNGLDGSVYKAEDDAETAIADNDYFPYFDTSANASKKSLWSNIKNVLKNTLAIKEHDSNSAGTYGAGTSSKYGHVKLSDTYNNGTSQANSSVGASEYAVSQVYSTITGRLNSANTSGGYAPTGMKTFTFDYKNGKYGWNESTDRSGTFHPFNSGAATISIYHGNATYTAPDSGKLYIVLVATIAAVDWSGGGGGTESTTITVTKGNTTITSCTASVTYSGNKELISSGATNTQPTVIDVNKNDVFTITAQEGGNDQKRECFACFFLV